MAAEKNTRNRAVSLAKAKTSTTGTQDSVHDVTANPGIRIAVRWFPADSTAILRKEKKEGDSATLRGLYLAIMRLDGEKPEPANPSKAISRLPEKEELHGKFDEYGCFVERPAMSKEELKKTKDEWPEVALHPLRLTVPPGTRIGFCIGVDSKAKFRKHPLWQVTAQENDIALDIFEVYGKHELDDKAKKVTSRDIGTPEKPHNIDCYTANLTGDIWLRSSHPYRSADVDALPEQLANSTVKSALKKIYAADFIQVQTNFAVDVQGDGDRANTVRLLWQANQNDNCVDNIQRLNLRTDIPSRVHPAAYAAAVRAAFTAGIDEVHLTNSWRPMLGAMPHRIGLGLDINYIKVGSQSLQLNRDGLRKRGRKENPNITGEEQDAYDEMLAAQEDERKAREHLENLEKVRAEADTKLAARKFDPAQHAVVLSALTDASNQHRITKAASDQAREAWNNAVKKNQPVVLDSYRNALINIKSVSQVLDPWYMETNTRDNTGPVPNDQHDINEQIHRHHLHITIRDNELL